MRSTLISDTWVIARRGFKHMLRQPEALADATAQPIMFVLLFGYVFGGAIEPPGGGSYREFLMGGIFAQSVAFGVFGVAISLAHDRRNGAIDRFRSLPIARAAFLAGHAVANVIRFLLPMTLMALTGLIIGWRIHAGFFDALAAFALMIAFAFAMIWIGVLLASTVKSPEGVQGVAFVAIFPFTFIASTFVPTNTMPKVLRAVAEWNPVSSLANAVRHLFGNPVDLTGPWPSRHPVVYTVIWAAAIVAIAAPLAVAAYQRSIRS